MATITTNFRESFPSDYVTTNKSNLTIICYFSPDNTVTYNYNLSVSCTCNGSTQWASASLSPRR